MANTFNIANLIDYFRRCYRADNNEPAIFDIAKIRKDRKIQFDEGEELLLGNTLPRLPLEPEHAQRLAAQARTYQAERRLIYGCLFAVGKRLFSSGFAQRQTLNAPIIYFPATLNEEGDEVYLEIDSSDLHFNRPLLRLFIKAEIKDSILEDLPKLSFPLDEQQLSHLSHWLRQYTEVGALEELGHWPKLQSIKRKASSDEQVQLQLRAAVLLVDRPRGARGVLHELTQLSQSHRWSNPLRALLSDPPPYASPIPQAATSYLPGTYSNAQKQAIYNALNETLSLISGPPGTGKSFTIAAIVIDHMLRKQPVLVISKTAQAVAVVGEKLAKEFALRSGFINCDERGYHQALMRHLDDLLHHGLEQGKATTECYKRVRVISKKLRRLENQLKQSFVAAARASSSGLTRWHAKWVLWRFGQHALYEKLELMEQLQGEFDRAAIDLLNTVRIEQVTQTLTHNRQQLVAFRKALSSRNSQTQSERFAKINFEQVLDAFPIWLSTAQELHKTIPLKLHMFSLVIVDEASQCDIASLLPALQRARRAVIVGDAKQLRHVSFLSRAQQKTLWQKSGLPLDPPPISYRDQSLLDLSAASIASQKAVTLLDEHYRSCAQLIAFSNALFYQNRLKIMQRAQPENNQALSFAKIDGSRLKNGSNPEEAEKIIALIHAMMERYAVSPVKPSIGVISPFRDQAEYIAELFSQRFSRSQVDDFSIKVATPYGFQGDERDYIFISVALDNDCLRAAAYLNREDMFNVLITRAKSAQTVVHSLDLAQLPQQNLLKRYRQQNGEAHSEQSPTIERDEFIREVQACLSERDIKSVIGFPVAGLHIDLMCIKNNRYLGLDLIGQGGATGDFYQLQDYKRFVRAGLKMLPFPLFLWQQDKQQLLDKIEQEIGQ